MYIATLLSNPAAPALDVASLDSVRNAWGGGEAAWLAPDIAAEFPLPAAPGNLAEVRDALGARGIDVVVQPTEGRRKRMLLADMDSTMIMQECIDELAAEAGIGNEVAEITRRAMNGDVGFEGALRERVALLKGLETGVVGRVLRQRITYTPGGRTLVATMRAQGGYTVLVSGGFTAFTETVAAELGFDEHRANTLGVSGGQLTGTVDEPILGREAKLATLEEVSVRLGLTPEDVLAVGDGANDLAMLHRAGTGVALHAKPSVAAQCDVRIDHGDLTALLYIQGYTRAEFADV